VFRLRRSALVCCVLLFCLLGVAAGAPADASTAVSNETAVGEVSYDNQGRATVMNVNVGLVRLYANQRTCQFVGAEMFGPRVEHMAHLLSWAHQEQMKVGEILQMPFYHPVCEEGLRTALRDLAGELGIEGRIMPEDCAESPGD